MLQTDYRLGEYLIHLTRTIKNSCMFRATLQTSPGLNNLACKILNFDGPFGYLTEAPQCTNNQSRATALSAPCPFVINGHFIIWKSIETLYAEYTIDVFLHSLS